MKRLLLLLISSTLLFQLQAQDIPAQQQTLVTKITASWCINCGTWGWEAHEKILEENTQFMIPITAHYSGDLRSQASRDFSANFESIGQPQFFLNNENTRLFASNGAEKRAAIQASILENASHSPLANTGVLYELSEGVLNATVKTKFFQAADGLYYVAAYVLESGVQNFQEGQGGIAIHKKVLRGTFTQRTFGSLLEDRNITEGAEYTEALSMIVPDSWDASNLDIVALIWKKEGDKYIFVNGSITPVTGTSNIPETPIPVEEAVDSTTIVDMTTTDSTNIVDMATTMDSAAITALNFSDFPWLMDLLSTQDCCDNKAVTVYNSGAYQFIFVDGDISCSSNMGTLYFQDGTFYCADGPGMDCRTAYQLTETAIVKTWVCGEMVISPESEAPTTTPEVPVEMPDIPAEDTENPDIPSDDTDSTIISVSHEAPDFSEFPWLADLVEVDNCCDNTTITAYYSSIYTFIFIEPRSDCDASYGQLYYQDGTFYCGDGETMDCRAAYQLSAERSTVLWSCSN